MKQAQAIGMSRRCLLARAGLSAGATPLARGPLFAKGPGADLVPAMIDAATKDKIVVHPVRRNILVLEGSGGNIAVLTGKDAPFGIRLNRETPWRTGMGVLGSRRRQGVLRTSPGCGDRRPRRQRQGGVSP